jgi:hypothetical protein
MSDSLVSPLKHVFAIYEQKRAQCFLLAMQEIVVKVGVKDI